jgi:hypothetical protein
VYLVEVEVVGSEAAKKISDRLHDPLAGTTTVVRCRAHRHEEFCGQEDVITAPGERFSDDFFGAAVGVNIRGINEVNAGVEGVVDDFDGVVGVRLKATSVPTTTPVQVTGVT